MGVQMDGAHSIEEGWGVVCEKGRVWSMRVGRETQRRRDVPHLRARSNSNALGSSNVMRGISPPPTSRIGKLGGGKAWGVGCSEPTNIIESSL